MQKFGIFRSVAEGIEHFKEGRHSEAFQCLNKALTIDPRNVEGLVARGALYANNGSLKKAVEDFEYALKINPTHSNARKYMGETLVALGRNYEEENCPEEAKKAYQDCLAIIPHHEEAQKSLNFLWNKGSGSSKQIIDMNDLALPGKFFLFVLFSVRFRYIRHFGCHGDGTYQRCLFINDAFLFSRFSLFFFWFTIHLLY